MNKYINMIARIENNLLLHYLDYLDQITQDQTNQIILYGQWTRAPLTAIHDAFNYAFKCRRFE